MGPPFPTLRLVNGSRIPTTGFGVFGSRLEATTRSCMQAIEAGYRHIDTADLYGNAAQVCEAVTRSPVHREEIFITTKLYTPPSTTTQIRSKLIRVIEEAGGENGFVDLLLVHNANIGKVKRKMLWQEMEKLYTEGRIKNLGVSNYGICHLEDLKEYSMVWPPVVNQLELHPWLQQHDVVEYCKLNHIALEAYCPLVRNQKSDDPTLKSIAKRVDRTTSQVLLRYSIQKGWIPLPKSENLDRIRQSADIFDWELNDTDMNLLDHMPQEPALVIAVDNEDRDHIWTPKNH
jgi:diketogulonate reductase-like aldo/keto reductase